MPVKTGVYNQEAQKIEDINLSDKVFNIDLNNDLIYQTFVVQDGNRRQISAHAKSRSEVRGGGRKPWRQKGTGRARAGTIRSPLWKGGGIIFGPNKERNFKRKINKKMKKKALRMVLTDKLRSGKLAVLDKLELKESKTRLMDQVLNNLEKKIFKIKDKKRSVLLILPQTEEKILRSGRNLPGVSIINVNNINIMDLLKYREVVFIKDAILKTEKVYK